MNTKKTKCGCTEDELCYDHQLPDSESTVGQIKEFGKWKKWSPYEQEIWEDGYNQPNYWKWACIAILLGTVAGMISLTPKIIEVIDVCTL